MVISLRGLCIGHCWVSLAIAAINSYTLLSLRPYGLVWVTIVGRATLPDLGGPPMGSRGSRLNLFDDRNDGASVPAFVSSSDCSTLSDPSDILSRCWVAPTWERRTASTVEPPIDDIEPAVEGRGRGGVADSGG